MKKFALAFMAALVVAGCGGGGGGGGGDDGGGGSPPPPPPPPGGGGSSGGSGGISGVTQGQLATGLYFVTGDAKSRYAIYVPPAYSSSTPIGLVLAFHGVEGTSNPTGWFQVCVYYANLDRFIIVAPYGDTTDGGSGAWSQPYGREIMDFVRSKYNIDNNKQYMSAISGGCYPGIWFALGSAPSTYTNYQGQTVKSGYQADFAAVGFTSPAYSPSGGDFGSVTYKTATQLGFTPALWTDYGQNSSDGGRAADLASWATAHGYTPVNNVMRPGEGHPPASPYSYVKQMFDMFEANPKP